MVPNQFKLEFKGVGVRFTVDLGDHGGEPVERVREERVQHGAEDEVPGAEVGGVGGAAG